MQSSGELTINAKELSIITNDECSIMTVAQLREYFCLSGPTTKDIDRFVNKISMKHFLKTVRRPKFMRFDQDKFDHMGDKYADLVLRQIPLPIFVKPINEVAASNTSLLR